MLRELHRDAEMRQDLARMRQLDGKPDAKQLRLYRARMLPKPGKPGSTRPTALAKSSPGPAGEEIPYQLGCIYLLDPASFRQETPLP